MCRYRRIGVPDLAIRYELNEPVQEVLRAIERRIAGRAGMV
jgi:hypothetical protein